MPTCTIDELLAEWPHVDFIKIDVEGAEAEAFDGMQLTLKKNPKVVHLVKCFVFLCRGHRTQ